jgi:hypothetical protein
MTVTEFAGDTAPLARLHAMCFPDAWDAAAIAALLATPGTFAFHSHDGFVLAGEGAWPCRDRQALQRRERDAAHGLLNHRRKPLRVAAIHWLENMGADVIAIE